MQNFSTTPILREIKFGVSRSKKSAVFTRLEAMNFDFYDSEPLKMQKRKLLHFNKLQN